MSWTLGTTNDSTDPTMDEGKIQQELLKAPTSTVTHVHKLLSKIATNPDEPKFRRLKTTSSLFRERFGDAGALLGALGFAADGDLCAREGADGVEAALRLVDARLAMSDGEVERARGPAPMETDDDDDDLARALAMSREAAPPPAAPPPPPVPEAPAPDAKARFQKRVGEIFAELMAAGGTTPNDAAAAALRRATAERAAPTVTLGDAVARWCRLQDSGDA